MECHSLDVQVSQASLALQVATLRSPFHTQANHSMHAEYQWSFYPRLACRLHKMMKMKSFWKPFYRTIRMKIIPGLLDNLNLVCNVLKFVSSLAFCSTLQGTIIISFQSLMFKLFNSFEKHFTLGACAFFDILCTPPISFGQQPRSFQIGDFPTREESGESIRATGKQQSFFILLI